MVVRKNNYQILDSIELCMFKTSIWIHCIYTVIILDSQTFSGLPELYL